MRTKSAKEPLANILIKNFILNFYIEIKKFLDNQNNGILIYSGNFAKIITRYSLSTFSPVSPAPQIVVTLLEKLYMIK